MITLYALPVVLALVVKLTLLMFAHRAGTKSEYLFGLIIAYVALNAAELMLFIEVGQDISGIAIVRSYYIAAAVAATYGCYYVYEIGRPNKSKRLLNVIVLPLAVMLIGLSFFTNVIVSGAESIGYGITAIKGSAYWVFSVLMFVVFAFIAYTLISGYKDTKHHAVQVKCTYALLAFSPIILAGVGVLAGMALGYKINAMAILPIATTAFIFIIVLSEKKHGLTDIRRFIPLSLESKLTTRIQNITGAYAQEAISHKEMLAEVEKLAVLYKLQKKGGNVSHISDSMGEPRSTVYWLCKRYNIDLKDFRST